MKMNKCPVSEKCGACNYINIPYKKEITLKQESLSSLFERKVEPIIKMNNPYNYRNKVHSVFKFYSNKVICGRYKNNSHFIVESDNCLIEDKKAQDIIVTIKKLVSDFKLKIFNEDSQSGLIRHVLIRHALNTDEIMVTLVVGENKFPSRRNFLKALLDKHPEITTVVLNYNRRKTSIILGDKEEVIFGKGYICEELCGLKFKLSSKSFFQVNTIQTEILYNTALKYAELKKDDVLLDAYCGTGTIGLIASRYVKRVIGVEINNESIKDAIQNAKMNKINNAFFINADATEYIKDVAEKIDIVIMDPTRDGSTVTFLNGIKKLKPKKIVYISCNPLTLKRDLSYLENDYKVEVLQPVDLFPHTKHTEMICVMKKMR